MRKHGGPPSRRDKHVTLAAISPPGVARGRFVGGQQSGLAGCKPPPLFTRGASSCSSQGRRQGEPWGASPRPSAPTYLPIPHTNRIHILPDLPNDYPRHIPRRLPNPVQDIPVVPLHPYGVSESIFLNFPLLGVFGPLLMLVLKCFAHLGCRVVRLSHHSVRIPGHFAMVQPRESA